MIASKLISEDILPLTLNDTINEALNRMQEYKVAHFPVTENGKLIGVLFEKDVYNHPERKGKISKDMLNAENLYVRDDQYVFDVLRLSNDQKLTIVPVVDESDRYLGSITMMDIITFFSNSMSIDLPGGVIVLEVNVNDYSLTEISNIVETNDAKILTSYILSRPDSTKMEVVIKVSKINLGAIIQTFERYEYIVKASFGEDYNYGELKSNYDSLMNYLNI